MIIVPFEKLQGRVYTIAVTDTGFEVKVTAAFYQLMVDMTSRMRINPYREIETKVVDEKFATYRVDMPFITFPNYKHKKLDWDSVNRIACELETLFCVIDLVVREFSEGSQNYLLAYISEESHHYWFDLGIADQYCSIEVAFTENAHARMRDCAYVSIRQAVEVVDLWYDKLTIRTKRSFERKAFRRSQPFGHTWTLVYVRAGYGVPQIQVPGNCACLGANPDDFKYDLTIIPHNLDHPWQLLLMLVAVVELGKWLDEMMKA